MLAAIGVGGRAELDREGDVFAKIAIRVEAKGVETLLAEGFRRADAVADSRYQSHDRCAWAAAKWREVADVETWDLLLQEGYRNDATCRIFS